ncbi:unnamed protein product [Orchesella dallaii]|uniref:Fanconi anemia group M protein n=1 Tax=Orchesella dallaii TaxID=48710 RepID=A0ABP1RJ01_9HEXA
MAAYARSQLLRKKTRSKYEEKGNDFALALREMIREKDYSIFYSYQIDAVLHTQRHLLIDVDAETSCDTQNGRRSECDPVLIVAPTGSGKSGMIVLLPYVLQSRKVLILTPSVVISKQLAKAFGIFKHEESFFQVTGFCNKNKTAVNADSSQDDEDEDEEDLENILETGIILKDPSEITSRLPNLVIVNAQKFGGKSKLSLQYNKKEVVGDVEAFFRQFDTLIVDEAHHYPAKTWVTIVDEFQKPAKGMQKRIIFITATPYRSIAGGKHIPILKNQHHRIAYEITAKDVEGKTVRRLAFDERTNIENLANDIEELLNDNARREPRITKHQAIVLVPRQDEADRIATELNDAMNSSTFAVSIVSNTKKEDKEKRIKDFGDGRYQVAVNCMLLNEGYDNNSVSVCVILRNVGSRILFEQFIGRAMRMKKFGEGEQPDQSVATILSYKEFKQRKLWTERNKLAKKDPVDEEGLYDDDDE